MADKWRFYENNDIFSFYIAATYKQNRMQIVASFYKTLDELIDNDPECRDVCELVYYKGTREIQDHLYPFSFIICFNFRL